MADYFAQNSYTTRKGKTKKLDYSKFDSIGKEFEESPRVSPSLEAARGLPPEIQLALAESQAAQASGDSARIAASLQAFEDKLQRAPPEFQRAMQSARVHRSIASSPPRASSTRATPLESELRDVDAVSAKLDSAFSLTEGVGDDPARMAEFLASTGLTEDDLLKAENSSDPAEAMRRLAELAVRNTLGGVRGSTAGKAAAKAKPESGARKGGSTKKGGDGGNKHKDAPAESCAGSAAAGSTSGGTSGAVPESLQAMICARDEAKAELERQRAHVAEAAAAAERTRAELHAVEAARRKQGEMVDASVAQAEVELVAASKAMNEAEEARARFVDELRSRGNVAMGRDDLHSALSFYTEALKSEGLTGTEELKLRGNRAACLLLMGQHEAAAADARAALRLDHTQAKNHFRLGSALSEMGDVAGALNSFRAARCFDYDNPEIERRIEALEELLPSGNGNKDGDEQNERVDPMASSLDPQQTVVPPGIAAADAPFTTHPAARPAAPEASHRDTEADARAQCENLRLRANALFKAGDMDTARRLYTRALGYVEEAYASRSTRVAKGESTPAAQLYANRCQAALALGDVGGALQDARWACDAAPDWPKAHFRLGSVFLHKKQFADAYGALKRASHLDPKNEELIEACRHAREKMLAAKGVPDHLAKEHDEKVIARAPRIEKPDTSTGQVGATPSAPSQSSPPTELRHALEHVGVCESSSGALKLRVWLPEGVVMAAVDLQVSSDVVVVTAAEAGVEMRVPLPIPVRDSEATASFSKKKGILTINLPVAPAAATAVLV